MFLAVHRTGSVSRAARELQVSPSVVSKGLTRLEEAMGVSLVERRTHGVVVLDAGMKLAGYFRRTINEISTFREGLKERRRHLSVATPPLLQSYFMPRVASQAPELRLRALEFVPGVLRSNISLGLFDVGIIIGDVPAPSSWLVDQVGVIEKDLLASPGVLEKLSPLPVEPERLREVPFVCPVYSVQGQFIAANDDCPLPLEHRIRGHETSTMHTALNLATVCEQVVFGPTVAALPQLDRGDLRIVPVRGWRVQDPLMLACDSTRVRASEHRLLVQVLTEATQELSDRLRVLRDAQSG